MFFYGIDKKWLYVLLAILILFSLRGLSQETIISTLLMVPAVLVAMTFHEFAHAFAADRLGDTTPRSQGRVTLNPISHIDPVGFVMLLFANIGWGKPVQINPNNFTSNKSKAACEAIVALAGPLMNIVLAIVFMIIYNLIVKFMPLTYYVQILELFVYAIVWVNIGLGVFNLIPIPPLDGSKIFSLILPYNVKQWIEDNYQMIYLVFMGLWITGFLGRITTPVVYAVYSVIEKLVGLLFGA